jgi:uncharacterized protein YhaN
MRLCQLVLVRFGPFTDTALELGRASGRLELVYGPNEAGKSTALRAVNGLLYGIPERTTDDHLHPMRDLRLTGELVSADGRLLQLTRLKRRKNSLLAPDGEPLDESVLARFLGGVTSSTFLHTFGLNHETLREAADALIEGKGDIGVSLFDAAMGGSGARAVLASLEEEAESLYSPRDRAGKRLVNHTLGELALATERVNNAITPPQSFLDQQAELNKKKAELADVDARRRKLLAEAERLRFALGAVPLFGEADRIARELAALGPVPILSAGAASRRERIVVERATLQKEIVHFEAELRSLGEKRREIFVPEGLQALAVDRVKDLGSRLGAYRTAQNDLPKRRARLAALEAERARLEQKLGPIRVEASPDAATRERLSALALGHGELVSAAERGSVDLAEQKQDIADKEQALSLLGEAEDHRVLERAVRVAERSGDLERTLAELAQESSATERAATALVQKLGLGQRSLGSIGELEPPLAETVQRFERDFERAERDLESAESALIANAERIADAERDLSALTRAGAVPSEVELAEVRGRRDADWRDLRSVLTAPKRKRDGLSEQLADHERAVQDSDEVADRLRREAERVAKVAHVEAEREAALAEKQRVFAHASACREVQDQLSREWNAAWQAVLAPKSPREMLAWLARFHELAEKLERLAQLADKRTSLEREREQQRSAVAGCLDSDSTADDGSLRALIDRAHAELDRRREIANRRATLEASLAETRGLVARTERRAREAELKLMGWQEEWAPAVARIGLAADALPAEVNAVLGVLADIELQDKEVRDLRERIAGMERDADLLSRHVAELLAEHAPDLASQSWPKAAHELERRHSEAMQNLVRASDLDRQIADSAKRVSESRQKLLRVEADLSALLDEAKVDDVSQLPEVEERVRAAQRLAEDRARNETQLAALIGSRTQVSAREEVWGVDLGEARGRLADIERELEELQEQQKELHADQRGLGVWLSELESSTRAAEAKADELALVAKARAGLERYLKLTLAARVLRREIDRYRERHQGPVLSRANELFQRLTVGRYSGVRPDVDSQDVATLRAVRASDGALIDVQGLSDGARDQLYLALRLATLEHYAASSEPLPLVLDDVLVHFDDERAKAALQVLAEVAQRMQILLFTHHAHVVKLAESELSPERLSVHELGRRDGTKPSEAAPGARPN